jgi:hypothetical protein
MRRFITIGIGVAFVAAVAAVLIAWALAKDGGADFWSNYLLNLGAELLGLAIAAMVASIVAKHKLDDWLPPVIELIANLRKIEKLDGPSAQSAVVCAVRLFSEDRFLRTQPPLPVLNDDATCQICWERPVIKESESRRTCTHCGLSVSRKTAV